MFYLYVLQNKSGRHYIGITENIEGRLAKHNSGSVVSTKAYRPWTLVYSEEHKTKREVRSRELYLKKSATARKKIFESKTGLIV